MEMRELLRATCAAVRVSKRNPHLWEVAARLEREQMAEIERLKREQAATSEQQPVMEAVAG